MGCSSSTTVPAMSLSSSHTMSGTSTACITHSIPKPSHVPLTQAAKALLEELGPSSAKAIAHMMDGRWQVRASQLGLALQGLGFRV